MSSNQMMVEDNAQEYTERVKFLNNSAHILFGQTDINDGIHQMLMQVREYFQADRAYLLENNYLTQMTFNTYEVCADGVNSEIENLQGVPFSCFISWFELFKRDNYIFISDVSKLKKDRDTERKILKAQGIQSLLAVPLRREELVIGFFGVDNPKENSTHIGRLTILGDYLTIALSSRNNVSKIKDENVLLTGIMNHIPGGVGVYNYYFDGRLEHVFLNDGYYSMIGVTREERVKYNGFSVLAAVHPEDGFLIKKTLKEALENNAYLDLDIRVRTGKGGYKWFNVKGSITSRQENHYSLYVFYSDIDQLKKTKLQLLARQQAMSLASNTGGLVFWIYNIDKKSVSPVFDDKPPIGFEEYAKNIPESMLDSRRVYAGDKELFKEMYEDLVNDAENCKCTVRIMNFEQNRYEWRHILYTRLHDESYSDRTAIGFSVSADQEQENCQHYERELQLRKSIIKNAIAYFQVNLTQNVIEEFQTIYGDWMEIHSGDKLTPNVCKGILNTVVESDQDIINENFSNEALLRKFHHGESSITAEFRALIPKQGIRWTQATATLTERFNSGEIIAFIFYRDIDVQKKDQLAIATIMDEEIESVTIINVQTGRAHFAQMNTKSEKVNIHEDFDYDKTYREMIHSYVIESDIESCDSFFYIDDLTMALKEEPVIKLVYRVIDRRGQKLRKKTRAFYLDETRREIILIRRDITDLYEEEQHQKKVLQKAVEEANMANHAKSVFLSHMSHDMRTPLNAVLAFSGEDIIEDANEEQLRDYLSKIHASGEYLLGIINDVLDMSKIEQNKMVLSKTPYSMDEFVQIINTVIKESCGNKGIEFIFDCQELSGKWIRIDKVRFNQIFMNLLSNAVKFTPAGGRIEFLTTSGPSKNENIEIRQFLIRDNGSGMSKEFIPHAFESFSQENSREIVESNQGTGLGLSIVKKIVELMQGTITLESRKGKGTTFTVEIPLEIVQPPEENHESDEAEISLRGMNILLCEDNDINAEIASHLLVKQGCLVERAENGRVGKEMFEKTKTGYYQVILMDVHMPVMDGYTATREIRGLSRTDALKIPIIAMTADAFIEDERNSREAGMNAHLSKPIEPDKLFKTLKNIERGTLH